MAGGIRFYLKHHQQNKDILPYGRMIFIDDTSDEGLTSKIRIKCSCTSTHKKQIIPITKWAEELNRHFSKQEIQVANRHMKRCSTSLIITETQTNTTMRYHLTQVRMATTQKTHNR